ncbi:MAG: KpsF/GutQ family sugar-phosphate isomerase [Candidatus Marinimicrobia bacterium]|nr:KpsF/GutQ family sugar-phosphate isomerase [Candidatus Neomarinimicrobiota bacterium]
MNKNKQLSLKNIASQTLKAEAKELNDAADRIDDAVVQTAKIILDHAGKVVICGIGKSGHIGQKIVATLCSTGIQAVFLHAAEALHGDLGIYHPGDPTILISKSGSTDELVRLLPILRKLKSPLIGLVGNINSPLANKVDVVLDASISREADPLGIVPTSSTTLTLAIGDALVAVLMTAREFNHEDFAAFHPGGDLGLRLILTAKDVMQPLNQVAVVTRSQNIREVVIQMTEKPQGAALVLSSDNKLNGIITEGDLRRCLAQNGDIDVLSVEEVMNSNPVTIRRKTLIQEAMTLMEDRVSQISVLAVLDEDGNTCVGLLRIHDVYQTKLF